MMNTFWQVFQVSCCLCNKKANLYQIYGVLERKERGTGGAEDQNGLLPIFGSLSRQRVMTLCHDVVPCCDMVLKPGARPGLGARDKQTDAVGMHARQSFLALCPDRNLCVAMLFLGILGGLGHDKGLLCRERDLSALCDDRNSVLRQGLGLG